LSNGQNSYTAATRALIETRRAMSEIGILMFAHQDLGAVRERIAGLVEGALASTEEAERQHRRAHRAYLELLSVPQHIDTEATTRPLSKDPRDA
jgi:hypothetical protein